MSIRLVLVDDHEMFRQSLCSLLEKHEKFRVVGEATSGREALSVVREQVPDVVVMDIAMKDLNGVEGARLIRAELPQVKILMLSGHSDRRFVKDALDAGASGYVLKFNAYEDLRRALEAVHHGKSYLSAEVTAPVIESSYATPSSLPGTEDRALSSREREILQLVAEGLTSHQIGRRLFLATSTVETHRRNVVRKLGLHGVAELTRYAIREGITTLDA